MSSMTEHMLRQKADFAKAHQEAHGNLDSFDKCWAEMEPRFLIEAKAAVDKEESQQAERQNAAVPDVKRSEMSVQQKTAFVSEHGQEAYTKLPE